MRLLKLLALLAALMVAAAAVQVASADGTPPFNFDAVLEPAPGGPGSGSGEVKFRQPGDADEVVYLNTHVWGLLPDSSYRLQRATDLVVDDNCRGTNWLTLGRDNFTPQAIETNPSGNGRARLSRDLTGVPPGRQFDIHFRVIDAADEVVLVTPCYQFTVR
jgi:hypothetical protein